MNHSKCGGGAGYDNEVASYGCGVIVRAGTVVGALHVPVPQHSGWLMSSHVLGVVLVILPSLSWDRIACQNLCLNVHTGWSRPESHTCSPPLSGASDLPPLNRGPRPLFRPMDR